ncbi:testis-expressed protein 10 homolog [Ostrinia furnacalis]|uniref:testis-expressed protein 10 homolog n=1 Tax=Ostrinia furnacalis TaxID=93504 RepID=UPI00103932B4|nr:testis-expressed protein 10 homolog [Ostrinia furnacalis]
MPQTGATRHQKFLKSEKSKTKLKSKKKDLPKGTNVTKTNFKVKKIVIKEQLKKRGTNEVLSSKKLNLKDLLSRLNHFNTKSRTEALDGIKDIITHADILDQNLGQIILAVTPLVLNVEKVVRHETLKVLQLVLSNVEIQKLDPFFDIMATYLRSAMTHIDTRIQEDSLLFLDLLLVCTPEKVVQYFHKILPNFLDMISKLRIDSKPGRTLTVNLGSQITSVKWRVKVLHRLKDYLSKYINLNQVQTKEKPSSKPAQKFDESKMNIYSLFNPVYTSVCSVSCFSSKNSQDVAPLDEVENFKHYVNTLMPLLYETWLEVCPKTSSGMNIETVINEDAAALLKHSLDVISLLFDLVQYQAIKNPSSDIGSIFNQKYKQSFSQHFVTSFPYVTNMRMKHKKSDDSVFEDLITDPKLVQENLKICHLYIKLNSNVNVKNQAKEINSVLNYLEKAFSHTAQDDTISTIINVLDTIFSKQNNWTKGSTVMIPIFQKIIREYFNENIDNSFKQKIFSLLCKIALNDWLKDFHTSESFERWLKNLPNILLEKSVTTQTVNILQIFAVRNNDIFCKVTKPNLTKIIQNLPKIVISDADNDTSIYFKLFSLLYWIKSWDGKSLNLLEQQLLDNEYKSDHGKYIFDTLRLRAGGIM